MLEAMLDTLYNSESGIGNTPRTYRQSAQGLSSRFTQNRKMKRKRFCKALRKQPYFVRRDLAFVDALLIPAGLDALSKRQLEALITTHRLYTQPRRVYKNKSRSTTNRIVSISHPHVRPIVRSKSC